MAQPAWLGGVVPGTYPARARELVQCAFRFNITLSITMQPNACLDELM